MSIPRAVVEGLSVLAGRVTALEAEVADLVAWREQRARMSGVPIWRGRLSPEAYAEMFGEMSCDDEAQ